ncbi:MAG: dihydroorotase [Aestuariivita sp.]|nr:dihydroorotase [Aestuariivita sp.]MCY4202335.1 dihydroorotase [Aestuariivita sp.]
MTTTLSIRRPDDWHLHLRDGAILSAVLPETARHFARAIIMPNLDPPILTGEQAVAYRERIRAALAKGSDFEPLMTLYLTENTDPNEVARAKRNGEIFALKLYPANATTNSASGVRDFSKIDAVLETMSEAGIPLCVHGEVTDDDVDIFDREAVFIDRVLDPIRRRHPELKVTLEHITTQTAVDYVNAATTKLAASITVHHLVINRNDLLAGGIRPHYYCLPIAKREEHRLALRKAATAGASKFFLGTDSAPHFDDGKEHPCGCAGCFTATNALAILAQVFEQEDALDKLEFFTSRNGPSFYGLSPNQERIILTRADAVAYPRKIDTQEGQITVFNPNMPLYWHID